MKRKPQLLMQQKLYRPENYLSIQQMLQSQKKAITPIKSSPHDTSLTFSISNGSSLRKSVDVSNYLHHQRTRTEVDLPLKNSIIQTQKARKPFVKSFFKLDLQNTSLNENTHPNEQLQLQDIIKHEPLIKTRRKKAEDEYSYRRNTTTNQESQKVMGFFQSVTSVVPDSCKARSRSLQHNQMSAKLRQMIDHVMENTQDFSEFIGSLKKPNRKL